MGASMFFPMMTDRALAYRTLFAVLLSALLLTPAGLAAQQRGMPARHEVFANSELERYLRVLQLVGDVGLQPWSVRAFSPTELDQLLPTGDHPWSDFYAFGPAGTSGAAWSILAPSVTTIYNSGFPEGTDDGAVWAGRGITFAASGGVAARYGPFSATLAPTIFWAQNAEFDLGSGNATGPARFRNAYRGGVDFPKRFGDGAYGRIDWGQSTLRADLLGVTAGISTANEFWGPAIHYPIILGSNAPGFAHVFLGTSAPVNIGIGSVHGRVLWGRLDQSDYSLATDDRARRLMTGFVGVMTIRGIPGLELGASRFFHSAWPDEFSSDELFKPFEGFLKAGLDEGDDDGPSPGSSPDNQLVSIFARWVFPRAGFEIFGEFGREDHNVDVRDFIAEPDHDSAYTIGMRKVARRANGSLVAVRGEITEGRISEIDLGRHQSMFYTHSNAVQGHTQRGQILGSPALFGGGGAILGLDLIDRTGRWSVDIERVQNGESPAEGGLSEGLDVSYSLGVERLLFRSGLELLGALKGVYELNRYFEDDAFNLNARVGVRARL